MTHVVARSVLVLLLLGLAGQAGSPARAGGGPDGETAPVPGGTAALLKGAGIESNVEPARALLVLARTFHGHLPGKKSDPGAAGRLAPDAAGRSAEFSDRVPTLLPREVWEQAVFGRPVEPARLAFEVLGDRRASLLYCGLFSLDVDTLAYLASQPALVARIYASGSGPFAAFAESLTVSGGAVALPGGPELVAQWERLVGEPAADPARFIPALLEREGGRVAWLLDTLASLDPAARRFALGSGLAALHSRLLDERLPIDFASRPFTRPSVDLAFVLGAVGVTGSGALAPPSDLSLWERVFTGGSRANPGAEVTADWLLGAFASLPGRERRTRLDTILFAQRVFQGFAGARGGDAGLAQALAAFGSHETLMLSLERLGFSRPEDYAAAARVADTLTAGLGRFRASLRLAMFQGALALVVRLREVGTIDDRVGRALVSSLLKLPATGDARFAGWLSGWIRHDLLPVLPGAAGDDVDDRLIDGLAGVGVPRPTPTVAWEDHAYRVDVAWAERQRLRRVRERQGGNSLSALFEIWWPKTRGENVGAYLAGLVSKLALPQDSGLFQAGGSGAAEASSPAPAGAARPAGTGAPRVSLAGSIYDSEDLLLGELLASYAYAVAIGDPDSTMLLGGNPADAHDFGLRAGSRSGEWAVAGNARRGSQVVECGSLLGLERALAVPSLRQTTLDAPAVAPNIGEWDLQGLAEAVADLNPLELDDGSLGALAADLRTGRERIRAAARNPADLDALAASAGVERWRRRLMRLAAADGAEAVLRDWSLGEVWSVGHDGPTPPALEAWGASQRVVTGGWDTALPRRLSAHQLAGRIGDGLLSARIADLQLRTAEYLAAARLPAALAPGVLRSALWDLAVNTRMADPDDWLAVLRAAQAVPDDRMADYVSALTADGPLVPRQDERRAW